MKPKPRVTLPRRACGPVEGPGSAGALLASKWLNRYRCACACERRLCPPGGLGASAPAAHVPGSKALPATLGTTGASGTGRIRSSSTAGRRSSHVHPALVLPAAADCARSQHPPRAATLARASPTQASLRRIPHVSPHPLPRQQEQGLPVGTLRGRRWTLPPVRPPRARHPHQGAHTVPPTGNPRR